MAKSNHRTGLFRIHAWIGLNVGFLLFVVCFSGTAAVFSEELGWLVEPSVRAAPPVAAEHQTISWQEMRDRVAAAYPHALIVSLSAPRGERWAARAIIAYSSKDVRLVLIDPYTGDLQGQKSSFNLVSFFRIFHKQFYIVPSIFTVHGTLVVGALAILLLAGVITGLLSIKRWWRAFLTLRGGRSRRLFWSDLHRLTGVWALVIAIVLTLTGIWYFAERILLDLGALTEEVPAVRLNADELRHGPAVLKPLDLDRAAALAQAAYPALNITQIALPVRPRDPLVFNGQADAWLVRDRANSVQMNPYTGEVLDVRRAADLGVFARWIETADPLHFGTFAGPVSQVVWFVAGLLICSGILTGLYGAWLRVGQNNDQGPGRRLASIAAILPTLVLLVSGLYGTWAFGGEALRLARSPVAVTPLMQGTLGPWGVSVARHDSEAAPPGRFLVEILFGGDGQPNFESAAISIDNPDKPAVTLRTQRLVDRLVTAAGCPQNDRPEDCRLYLAMTEWDGSRHSLSLDLSRPSAAAANRPLPVTTGMNMGEVAVIAAFVLCLLLPLAGWIRLHFRLMGSTSPADAESSGQIRLRTGKF